ncbi:MAG TPA: hypothetical protein VK668_17465 [Mucilaginibacter sp.]|nr:hypothetical protein [Mucilaginibacter sp.]
MKKSITLAALLLVMGTSVFAATSAKSDSKKSSSEITFAPLSADRGFTVKVDKQEAGKSLVMIYDRDQNVMFKDLLTKGAVAQKGYVITDLENGDYTVEVVSNNQTVKKQMHVYNEGNEKTYFFYE